MFWECSRCLRVRMHVCHDILKLRCLVCRDSHKCLGCLQRQDAMCVGCKIRWYINNECDTCIYIHTCAFSHVDVYELISIWPRVCKRTRSDQEPDGTGMFSMVLIKTGPIPSSLNLESISFDPVLDFKYGTVHPNHLDRTRLF